MKQVDIFELDKEVEKLPDGSTLIYRPMEQVMHESMMPYAEHVILDRALPRVEDGLKPVQRRILYSMYEQGVLPDKPTRKSARIVGDCMGRYHPHGDSSIYDAMVRMAQPFSMNSCLVEGQGNFGNVDGDSAAAMRYTEARLTPLALELLRDIEKDTVKWSRNFDDTTKEPDMLPGRYPNLLVNGASGIAVGLATNIPPHNLNEVIDGVVAFIDNKNITLKNMMKIIKGPDFPTGGYVITGEGLEQAYETGKGRIVIRAKVHIEVAPNDRRNIVITELPYQVNKADLLVKIANLKDDKKELLAGVAEIVDESDKDGMRAVIKVKRDYDPKQILNVLFKHTQLETGFSINTVAIADGKPQLMGLLDIIAYYTSYQREVVLRRSKYEMEEAKAREHIVMGLVVAVNNIDEVIRIIKSANGTPDAKQKLRIAFDLSDRQAQAILDLRLARITKLEVNKLEIELKELQATIKRLSIIINSKVEQMNVVKNELLAVKKQHRTGRRSEIVGAIENTSIVSEADEKPVETVMVAIAGDYKIKKIPQKNFNLSNKDAFGTDLNGVLTNLAETQSNSKVMFFSNFGNCYQINVEDLPEVKFRDSGVALSEIFDDTEKGEFAVKLFVMDREEMPKGEILVFTRQGSVKRTSWEDYKLLKTSFQGYKGKDGDEVFRVEEAFEGSQIFYVTNRGGCIRFNSSEVPLQGRVAGGVKAITLNEGEYVVSCGQVVTDSGEMLMVTDKGFMKRLPVKDISRHARACKGAKGIEFGQNNGKAVVFASYVNKEPYNIAIYDKANTLICSTDDVSVEGKNTKGKLPKGKKGTINVAKVVKYKSVPDQVYKEEK